MSCDSKQIAKHQSAEPNLSKHDMQQYESSQTTTHELQTRFDCNAEVKSTYNSSQSNISSCNILLTASIPITTLSDDSTYGDIEVKSVKNFKSKTLPPINVSYFSNSHKPYSNICREMMIVFNTIKKKCVQSIFCDNVLKQTNRAKSLYEIISPLYFEIVKYRTKFILPLIAKTLCELNETLRHIVGLFVKFRSKQIVSGPKKHSNTLKDCIDSDLNIIENYTVIIIPGLRRSKQLITIFHRNLKILSFWIELFRNDHEHYECMTWYQFVVRIRDYKACKNLKKFPLKRMISILKHKYNTQHTEESITSVQFAEYFTCYDNVRKLSKAIYTYIDHHITIKNNPLTSNASPSPLPYLMSSQSSYAIPLSDDNDDNEIDNEDIDEDEVDQDEPDEILDLPLPIWTKPAISLPLTHASSEKQIACTQRQSMQRSFSVSQALCRKKSFESHMHCIDEKTYIRPLSPLLLDPVPQKKEMLVIHKTSNNPQLQNKSASYNRQKRKTSRTLRHKPKWKNDSSESVGSISMHNIKEQSSDRESSYDSDGSCASIIANDEFPVDSLPDHVTSSPHFTYSPEPEPDPFTMIPYKEAHDDLQQNDIIYHGLFKVYSCGQRSDVDIGALLTMQRLYFVSAINYQTWTEFQQRTKIDTLINAKKENESKQITYKLAMQLIQNMDIVEEQSAPRLLPYFENNTKKEIMLHIVLNTTNREKMKKLSSYFHLDQDMNDMNEILNVKNDCVYLQAEASKDTKYIKIKGIHFVAESLRKDLLDYVLNDIAFIEETYVQSTCAGDDNDFIVITLCDYHYKEQILNQLNNKKRMYFKKNGLKHEQNVFFAEHDGNRIHNQFTDLTQIQFIDLRSYDRVKAVNRYDTVDSYGFCIYSSNCNKEDNINVRMPLNNTRHEWISYIDYVLYTIQKKEEEDEEKIVEEHEQSAKWLSAPMISINEHLVIEYDPTKQKLLNDFTEQNKSDSEPKDNDEIARKAYSTHFNFGIYLNYWQQGFENSVIAKYGTLKEELLKNKISVINKLSYYELFEECVHLYKIKGFEIKAQTVGPNNAKCNVPRGSSITINHLIALKIYTDYDKTQCLFKQHCRRYNEDESMQQFIRRNQEIANWCRYIRESTTFFGEKMRFKKMWTGLKERLIFPSLTQHFYCPLSTTVEKNIAENFCQDHGVILKLKAAHGKARYFDVSWLSSHKSEKERLIMGARMKICDIIIHYVSLKSYIYALQLLEQILNGYAIVTRPGIEEELYKMIATVLGINNDKAYNIPEYIDLLLKKRIKEMERKMRCKALHQLQRMWLNHMGITRLKHAKLKCLFGGCLFKEINHRISVSNVRKHDSCGLFFRHFKIKFKDINEVMRFYWKIEGKQYERFKNMKARKCIHSPNFDYFLNDCEKEKIQFHLTCYPKYTHEKQKCALFVHMHTERKDIEYIQVEYDLWCDWGDVHNNKYYQHVMIPQVLNQKKNYCGCQTFSSNKIKHKYMIWNIGIKIIEVKYNRNYRNIEEKFWSDSELSSKIKQTNSELMELLGKMTKINQVKNAEMEALKNQLAQLQKRNEMLEMENKMRQMKKEK